MNSNSYMTTKAVILSFDDNKEGDFTYAKPILDKYGFKATFFVICGKTGRGVYELARNSRFAKGWHGYRIAHNDSSPS